MTGQLTTTTRPSGRTEQLQYWNSGQVATTTYSQPDEDPVVVNQWYDDHGRRTLMTDPTGNAAYTWDRADNLTGFTQPGGHNATYGYQRAYDLEGRPVQITYQPGDTGREHKVRNHHDRLGALTAAEVWVPQIEGWWPISETTYDDDGKLLEEIVNSTAGTRSWHYQANGATQPDEYHQDLTTGGDIDSDLTWDHAGRRLTESFNTYSVDYAYDEAGQLVGRTGAGPDYAYYYDPRGYRTAQQVDDITTDYTVNADGEVTEADPTSGPTVTYTYDDDGRRTSSDDGTDTHTTTYDPRGLPATIVHDLDGTTNDSTTARTYDGDGRLTRADFGDVDFDFTWDPSLAVPQILEAYVDEGVWSRLTYANERIGYEFLYNEALAGYGTYGYNFDGSVVPTDITIPAPYGYDPYGTPNNPPDQPFWYGYRAETHADGLIHLRNRDYDPTTGTFTTPDPIDGQPGTPTQTNTYHYTDNNPINRTDPLGLFSLSLGDIRNSFLTAFHDAANNVGTYAPQILAGATVALATTAAVTACTALCVVGLGLIVVGGYLITIAAQDYLHVPRQLRLPDPLGLVSQSRPQTATTGQTTDQTGQRQCSAPQTGPGDCDEGAELFHGTDSDAARDIIANGFSVEAARAAGGDTRFYLTEDFGAAAWFARANPRERDPAVVRAFLPISVERAVATGLLSPEPLPGAYTVANLPAFEAIAHYSLVGL
ncbi:MAG: RHS repeat-associated core domain-containing protein [Microthrixaceae bacterium]|nr:RHS repeat-associated core domain-containing protein [Microthrixaceae bacterium]